VPEPAAPKKFEISVSNLTAGQPLSPITVFILDDTQANTFTVGMPATAALELMAEGGDNSGLLEAVDSLGEASGAAPVGPGGIDSVELQVEADDDTALSLTVLTMLVNTNDAFTGVNGADISDLAVGSSRSFRTPGYDSGTEANSEATGTIPGPADGGEGFNAARDDVADQVTMHAGVVTAADGYSGSVLGQQHRWDNPVTTVTVMRVQ
tara:strand:- start:13224 stop:13850 length:627 start_codon:yes stop_codon:yes gene_type:complete